MQTFATNKPKLLAWFALINGLFATAISGSYFSYLSQLPTEWVSWVYLLGSVFGHTAFLVLLSVLVAAPVVYFTGGVLRRALLAILATVLLGVLLVDVQVFAQYRFHINMLVLKMILSGGMVTFSLSAWLTLALAGAILVTLQWMLLRGIETKSHALSSRWPKAYFQLGFGVLLGVNVMHCWAAAHAYQPVTSLSRYLPLYAPATATSFMREQGWVDEQALEAQKKMKVAATGTLNYPTHPLRVRTPATRPDIVMIVIDAWRADSFSPQVTPNIWAASAGGRVLPHHYSAGNATRTGIFGLFYGIPGTYWNAFFNTNRAPLLMDRLQALNYDMGIYASAHLLRPQFNLTVFSQIENLRERSPGKTAVARDKSITREWLQWDRSRDPQKSGFSFLFYDAAHDYSFPQDYPHHFQPMLKEVNHLEFGPGYDPLPLTNRYRNALHFIDDQVGQVIDHLKQQGRWDNTLIVITGDHGEEMNDNGLNYWGHSSNYTDSQVKVPMILLGPGVEAMTTGETQLTSHVDLAPSLLKQYLGVDNSAREFSTGINWFAPEQPAREWLLCASYSTYALLTQNNIIEVSMSGNYQVMDKTNRVMPEQTLDFSQFQLALEELGRFYQ